jgi:hypothetical protein
MALPVIADTFRVTINGQPFDGVTPHNVFHIEAPSGNEDDVAAAINDIMPLPMWLPVPGPNQATDMDIIKLDGVHASASYDLTGWNAEGGSDPVPATAAVVSLKTAQRGPQGRGRQYVGPVGEANQDGGELDPDNRADLQTAWLDFTGGLESHDMGLVVASYVHAAAYPVVGIHVDNLLGTQRRRQDQKRH